MKQICRFCTYYRPDERFRGKIGICSLDNNPTMITDTCYEFVKGGQHWLNGEKVEDNDD